VTQVGSLKINLSRSLHAEVQDQVPQVMQVWFEPSSRPGQGGLGAPLPLQVLEGRIQLTPQTLTWTSAHAANALAETFRGGGRVLIRLHCGFLYDANRRPFSAAPEAVLTLDSLRLPGGVLETWFFVRA
jgi:hypothetical protein